ncbi:MAG: DNA-directed RNA polymerase subunit alpha, partial [Ignavibacteria bacterium]|nr:DNA-directed RNA polymerase subunit alpha [Ignavibacteria bacterium]
MSLSFIQLPESIVLDESTYSSTFGRFYIQPLERGFGVTIGNALRRILISSLPGAAITAIKIDGILHEFSTINGVKEDVSEIILNLKQVRMKLINKKVNKVNLSLKGPSDFKAIEIQKQCPDIEILNPDLHIASLNKQASFEIELRIGRGKGYVPSEENRPSDQTIGLIPIDSIFSPIKNAMYYVEPTRIGAKSDFEKLTIEITTDGSITPEDALTLSAKILRDHFQLFINFEIEPEEESKLSEEDSEKARIKKILQINVDDLELSVRCHNCLKAANISTLADLVSREESELLKFRNFGRKSLDELNHIIEEYGLHFGMDVGKYLN